jgi:alpha-beta hydrolase superfamily lysophospholipase
LMTETEERFVSVAAGRKLHRWAFSPSAGQPIRFGVLMAHGWGDHIGCHRRAARMFTDRGGLAMGVDWPGNGWSTGIRGHMGGIDEAVAILHEALASLRGEIRQRGEKREGEAESMPLFFYAHSTGAMLGLKFLTEVSAGTFRAVWLGSPLVKAEAGQAKWKRWVARTLAKIAPVLPVDTGVREDRCRRPDPETGSFGNLKRRHPLISVSFGDELARTFENGEVMRWAAQIDGATPLLMTLGEDDTVCLPEYGRELFEALPVSDKTLIVLPGFCHEPLLDPGAEEMVAEVDPWLDQLLL